MVGPDRWQFTTGSQRHRDPRFTPYAFTEHGAPMAANVLRSEIRGKPDKLDRQDKPERLEKPDRPDRPDKPERRRGLA